MRRKNLVLLPLAGLCFLHVFVVFYLRLFEPVLLWSLKEVQSPMIHVVQSPMIHVNQECKFVYLDLGSNKGVQIRKLYEPWLYPGAAIIPFFDSLFGNITKSSRRGDVCSFGFEANPRHMGRLKHIEQSYRRKGLNVTFYNNAVSDRTGEHVTIYSDTNFDIDWGAGILDTAIDNKTNMTEYKVLTIDIVDFIRSQILPLKPKAVFMKMDIEGSEFIVLPLMLQTSTLCKDIITSFVIELHEWAKKPMGSTLSFDDLKKMMSKQGCVPSEVVYVDDESFLHDVIVDPNW
ncbi:hypothetical protein DPMN_118621 [Dreissena polymorpha]|uniref:Methyltransferase FkbM domain-containing protein n=1 Tax=Dreissena polymorpha TaxID=45954 RepID=A0A9D4GHR4_DREPO|nr:hypothetical protein DPMN_118621 [Dreissena polymorpha]